MANSENKEKKEPKGEWEGNPKLQTTIQKGDLTESVDYKGNSKLRDRIELGE